MESNFQSEGWRNIIVSSLILNICSKVKSQVQYKIRNACKIFLLSSVSKKQAHSFILTLINFLPSVFEPFQERWDPKNYSPLQINKYRLVLMITVGWGITPIVSLGHEQTLRGIGSTITSSISWWSTSISMMMSVKN